jgi:phage gp36-like protein
MASSVYSTVANLLLGDLPVPLEVGRQKFIDDAADEVDSILGVRYITPIDVTEGSDVPRYARLMVKRAANHLASGRLIMALAIGGEDNALHAYGYSLVQNALKWLDSIACGDFDIPGAVLNEDTQNFTSRGPKIGNVDASSGVENFYGQVMAPPLLINPIQVDEFFHSG